MTTRSTVTRTITVPIEVDVTVTVEWEHYPGVWRTPNGDGCPPSSTPNLVCWEHSHERTRAAIEDAIVEAIDDGEMDDE